MSKQEACHIPNQKLSSRMVKDHPERGIKSGRKGMMARLEVSMDRVDSRYKGSTIMFIKKESIQ